ncbi:LysE family transporter [Bosea sp. NPDC003192]|uniref:LysE family transporter n=1 Tax=Bosea sp. NPDC003192 TaxID=3390551 RepID=UPI003D038DE3
MFSIDQPDVILSLAGTYALIAVTPGPNFAVVAQCGLSASRAKAAAAAFGVALGAGLVAMAAASGAASLLALGPSRLAIGLGFTLLLLWLALGSLRTAHISATQPRRCEEVSLARCLRLGLLTATSNPLTFAFFLGLSSAPGCGAQGCSPASAFLAAFAVALVWFGCVALLLSDRRVARLCTGKRAGMHVAIAALLACHAAWAATATIRLL